MQIDLPIELFTYPEIALPDIWTVEQLYDTPTLTEAQITVQVRESVANLLQGAGLKPGAAVAVGTGSRGLDNLVLVIRTVVTALREAGLAPFIIPAMGSHGGATAEGQRAVLEEYGITQEAVGAEIRATMEVVEVGQLSGEEQLSERSEDKSPSNSKTSGTNVEKRHNTYAGHPIYCDRNAAEADAVLLVNRVKAHTDFVSDLESGIAKMSVIGLGKRHGAASIHRYGAQGLVNLIPRIARALPNLIPLLGGIALIENEAGCTSEIHALPAADIAREPEKALLRRAREIAPHLPFQSLDVLIIDEMGKNISGCGMDTHVIGRGNMPSIPEHTWGGPDIRLIAVLNLTHASQGNVTAVGLADMATQRLIEKADWQSSIINMRTSGEGGVLRCRLPLILPTGEDCIRTGIATCGRAEPADVRLARIRNTADTRFIEITEALLEEARGDPRLRISETSNTIDLCAAVGKSQLER